MLDPILVWYYFLSGLNWTTRKLSRTELGIHSNNEWTNESDLDWKIWNLQWWRKRHRRKGGEYNTGGTSHAAAMNEWSGFGWGEASDVHCLPSCCCPRRHDWLIDWFSLLLSFVITSFVHNTFYIYFITVYLSIFLLQYLFIYFGTKIIND